MSNDQSGITARRREWREEDSNGTFDSVVDHHADDTQGRTVRLPDRQKQNSNFNLIFQCIISVACGLIFGFAMEKGRVFEPRFIRNQMVLSKFVMLKMFLSAVASGLFGMSLLAMFPQTRHKFVTVCNKYHKHLGEKGVLACVAGGAMLGLGMVLAGSCPTSIFTQVGAMVPNVGYTFAGALAASFAYGILKPVLDLLFFPGTQESSNPWAHSPYFIMALPLVTMFGLLVCAFEILIHWTVDVKVKNPDAPLLERKAWPPYVSGAIIGMLQVPLMLNLEETLGGSSSFLTMVSQVLIGPLKKLSPWLCKYKWGFASWWQIFYVSGVMYGAYLSASWSSSLGSTRGVPAMHAFWGGFLMIFGARIAGGCTSGHGLSGMGMLSIKSFITVAAMFAGAMPLAYVMKHFRALKV